MKHLVSLPINDFFLIYLFRESDKSCRKWEMIVRVTDFYKQMKDPLPEYTSLYTGLSSGASPKYTEPPSGNPPHYPGLLPTAIHH